VPAFTSNVKTLPYVMQNENEISMWAKNLKNLSIDINIKE
jgi:hypothetical protein